MEARYRRRRSRPRPSARPSRPAAGATSDRPATIYGPCPARGGLDARVGSPRWTGSGATDAARDRSACECEGPHSTRDAAGHERLHAALLRRWDSLPLSQTCAVRARRRYAWSEQDTRNPPLNGELRLLQRFRDCDVEGMSSGHRKRTAELTEAVRLDEVKKVYGRGNSAVVCAGRRDARLEARQLHRGDGPVGIRKSTFLHCCRRPGSSPRRARCA